MSCPKCGASEVHLTSGRVHSWEPESNKCILCGNRAELVMHSSQAEQRMKEVMKKNSKSFKDCAGGCGARIAINNNKSDLCRKCRKVKY